MYFFTLILVGTGTAAGLWKFRGRLSTPHHDATRLHAITLPFIALGMQFWALVRDDGSHRLALMGMSFLLLSAFSLRNRSQRPLLLLLLGTVLNFAPILVHDGYMPITPETMAALFPGHSGPWTVGLTRPGSKDVIVNAADSPLWFLGDVFAIGSPFPMPTAFSIGDIVILVSYLWAVFHFAGRQTNLSPTAN